MSVELERWDDALTHAMTLRVRFSDGDVHTRVFSDTRDEDRRALLTVDRAYGRRIELLATIDQLSAEERRNAIAVEQTLAIEYLFPHLKHDPRLPA